METLLLQTALLSPLCASCFLGALGQEILHWYSLKIELKENVKFYKSSTYWIISIVSIIFFGLTAKLLAEFVLPQPITNSQLFITAFAYPIIIKKAMGLITKTFDRGTQTQTSGFAPQNENKAFEINDYFKNY